MGASGRDRGEVTNSYRNFDVVMQKGEALNWTRARRRNSDGLSAGVPHLSFHIGFREQRALLLLYK